MTCFRFNFAMIATLIIYEDDFMRRILFFFSLLAFSPSASTVVFASDWSLGSNVSLTSDYVFRGYTQTDAEPAIQGGFDVNHSSGFFASVWASNVESNPNAPVNYDGANVEIDVFLGWKGKITDSGLELTVRALRFMYPGTDYNENNSNEYAILLDYDLTTIALNGSINFSDDYFGIGKAWYFDAGVDIPVGPVNISLQAGRSDYDAGGDYSDYSIGISGELIGFGLALSYIDTDGVPGGCVTRSCKERLVFTLSKEF